MTNVIYPGTFDPITYGHLDIIERTTRLFPRVLVAVANSPSKKPLFDLSQRLELVKQATKHFTNVEVIGFSDLLANVVKQRKINAIIRGVRSTTDFEYELQLAALNRSLTGGVESLFFPASEKLSYVSSTFVREIYLHGGDVSAFVPANVLTALQDRANKAQN